MDILFTILQVYMVVGMTYAAVQMFVNNAKVMNWDTGEPLNEISIFLILTMLWPWIVYRINIKK